MNSVLLEKKIVSCSVNIPSSGSIGHTENYNYLTFIAFFAFPSNSQDDFGVGRPLTTAGILICEPALQTRQSCAPISMKTSGTSAIP